jgi:hypothetical protein
MITILLTGKFCFDHLIFSIGVEQNRFNFVIFLPVRFVQLPVCCVQYKKIVFNKDLSLLPF